MELNELPQMDPRALKATSVKAEDEHANSAEPQALKITAASSNPKMFTLPWHKPLATWPEDLLANLPRGISRHVVRFVHVGDEVYAMKEITRQVAEREYEILRRLQKLELPTVTPIAVVIGRHTREGEPLEAILVTRHLKFSLPYRALFARNLRPDTAERLIDALAVLLVRLHLAGFYWGDVSCSCATPTLSPPSWWTPRPVTCKPSSPTASANTISTWPAPTSSANLWIWRPASYCPATWMRSRWATA